MKDLKNLTRKGILAATILFIGNSLINADQGEQTREITGSIIAYFNGQPDDNPDTRNDVAGRTTVTFYFQEGWADGPKTKVGSVTTKSKKNSTNWRTPTEFTLRVPAKAGILSWKGVAGKRGHRWESSESQREVDEQTHDLGEALVIYLDDKGHWLPFFRERADVNRDGEVDAADAAVVLSYFGEQTTSSNEHADVTDDGVIDAADAGAVFSNWGK